MAQHHWTAIRLMGNAMRVAVVSHLQFVTQFFYPDTALALRPNGLWLRLNVFPKSICFKHRHVMPVVFPTSKILPPSIVAGGSSADETQAAIFNMRLIT